LTAGLGMLGGTSPYAMANIGQGALAGVQQLNEFKKQRAAEQAALDKSMLYATRYQGAEELNKQNAAYNRAMKEKQYLLDVAKHGTEQEKIAVNQYNTHIKTQMDNLIAKNPTLVGDEAGIAKALDKINNEKITLQLRKKAFPDLPIESSSSITFTPKQEFLLSKYLPK
jgi:signal-transduction protein with cAMP-binding, CBS, and nucleotidyltransferase domain